MRDRLVNVVEKAELAVASSSGVVSGEALQPIIRLVKTIRVRMAHPDDVLVVALAGGTGSGKSSLFNALVGEEAVDVGGIRPTTSDAAASVPLSAGTAFDGFLDHVDIRERHTHDEPPLCIIDLPDTDSVEVEHRHRVDQLLPMVDAVVWVTDPEKYRDARLHHDYLQPLAEHSERFIVVLNQMDRLGPTELESVLTDLASALATDGLSDHVPVPIAALPPAGPPIGLDELVARLESMRTERQFVSQKLLADLASTARSLAAGAGDSLDFDARAKVVVAEAVESLRAGDADRATAGVTDFLDGIAGEVGGPTGRRIARLAADVRAHVMRIDSELRPEPARRWFRRRRPAPFDISAAESKLGEAVVRPARAALAQRAVALATVTDLAVEVDSLSRELTS